MNVLMQISTLVRRRIRGKRLGIDFHRSASWTIPSEMALRSGRWVIEAPPHNGCKLAFLEIFLDDCYGIESVKPPVRTVLDIGANAGFFSIHARNVFPNALIHAYEPNPAMEKFLQHQSATGGFVYFLEAVGAVDGKVTLDADLDSTHVRTHASPSGEITQVALRSCIQRLGGTVDVLKLDCEGAEWDIFTDTAAWQNVRYAAIEYHLQHNQTRHLASESVTALGFRIRKHTTDGPSRGLLWAERR